MDFSLSTAYVTYHQVKSLRAVMSHSKYPSQQLIDSLVYYNTKYRLAICIPCGTVFPKHIATHIKKYHNGFTSAERATIVNYIKELDVQSIDDVAKTLSATIEIDAIEGLPTQTITGCQNCNILSAESTMIGHCQREHSWTSSKRITIIYVSDNRSNVDLPGGSNTTK